ncbi:PRRC1 [Paramuricea clavata]|uniref:PRRC1 n=1 Tax=Paramuricea clavata TaxID=317549 RepID=A0A6S7IE57_PARCT|nr:PRRC1 [Paramuricea clavata]
MATMNVGSSDITNQDEIAREMASAIADDSSTKTSSNFDQGELGQSTNLVSSESGSFVRISTTEGGKVAASQAAKTGTVALNFGEGSGPVIQDDSSQVSSQGVWGWISSAVGSDIVETTQRLGRNLVKKTKDSVDSVITTLDPGMEDYLHKTDSDTINILITSTDEEIIDGIKDGFKQVFSHVLVRHQASRSSLAPLPNSFSSALKSAKQRISNLRSSTPPEVGLVVIAVEEFIAEIMPEMWFGMLCLCLDDSSQKLEVETFSQALALPNDVLKKLEELTPSTYSLRWSGLSVSLADVLQSNWTNFLAGVPKRQVVTLAAKTLAGQYRETVQRNASLIENSVTL